MSILEKLQGALGEKQKSLEDKIEDILKERLIKQTPQYIVVEPELMKNVSELTLHTTNNNTNNAKLNGFNANMVIVDEFEDIEENKYYGTWTITTSSSS